MLQLWYLCYEDYPSIDSSYPFCLPLFVVKVAYQEVGLYILRHPYPAFHHLIAPLRQG
jgi:hypothetical protein